jgi:hypothetical protein
VLGVAGSAAQAGLYFLPPADVQAAISPDASAVVFFRTSDPYVTSQQSGLYVTSPTGAGTRLLPLETGSSFALSPTWHWIAITDQPGADGIVVSRPDGSERRLVAAGMHPYPELSFSPDESRLAFANAGGVWTVGIDGTPPAPVHAGKSPAWSPVGGGLALVDGPRVLLAQGGAVRDLGPAGLTALSWSPDGSRIAFGATNSLVVVRVADASRRSYPARGGPSAVAWSPDSRRVAYLDSRGLHVLTPDVGASARRLSPFGVVPPSAPPPGLDWAPSGDWLVFSANGGCRDRIGLYRVPASGASAPVRITNPCRIQGTNGPDTISGTELYDVIVGGGGDDVLRAVDDNYQGDDLYGGPGKDTLTGDVWGNVLDGGPGNDRIDGRSRDDTLRGGPGRDVLIGGTGKDTIYARDGERDVVDCGTNGPLNPERPDVAYVDARDVVVHCERVYRR